MIRKISCLALILLAGAGCSSREEPAGTPEPEQQADTQVRPQVRLTDETTEQLWRASVKDSQGKRVVEERIGYRSGHLARILLSLTGMPLRVNVTEGDNEHPVYEAAYDGEGRRLVKVSRYDSGGQLVSVMERSNNIETWRFYRPDRTLARQETVHPDGSHGIVEFGPDGNTVVSSTTRPAERKEVVLTTRFHEGWTLPRLKLVLQGSRILEWHHLDAQGKIEHTGRFTDDGGIELRCFTAEGKLKRTQLYVLAGEDWNRPHYRLVYMEGFWPDGKTARWKVHLHPNLHLKHISMFYSNGALESARDFNEQGWHINNIQFEENGKLKSRHVYAPGVFVRGFTPDGLREVPGSEKDMPPLYDFGGQPFASPPAVPPHHPLFVIPREPAPSEKR